MFIRNLLEKETSCTMDKDEYALSEHDIHLFNNGVHFRLYRNLGAHSCGMGGVCFAIWAPNAQHVSVVGDFNNWNQSANPLARFRQSSIWCGQVADAKVGDRYRFFISANAGSYRTERLDPFAFYSNHEASIVSDLSFQWNDLEWMRKRATTKAIEAPLTIYEVHLPSWKECLTGSRGVQNYAVLAAPLADHVLKMGFTHVELMPLMEHPDKRSWGYKTSGYYAPSSWYGKPQDLMFLIDWLHRKGIGVILDWSPAHFAPEWQGLGYLDGSHLYEHPDPRRHRNLQWTSLVFNYDIPEVRSFLLSAGFFWLDKYHIDGFRIDAVTAMLYLDFAKRDGEWLPNEQGGKDNKGAKLFLQQLNEGIYKEFPGVETFAEESTDWPKVSGSTDLDGLGFGFKWDVGWANDILRYLGKDPVYRKYHHNNLTFRMLYFDKEKFLLPLSHDEIAHGRGSLVQQMPGTEWEKFANVRLLYAYMYGQSGKKLLFMGNEFAQDAEWRYDGWLHWHLCELTPHAGVMKWVQDLNSLYRKERALHDIGSVRDGFEWIDCRDCDHSVVSFLRLTGSAASMILAVFNFTPVVRHDYRLGVPSLGCWREKLNSDSKYYWGKNFGNFGKVYSTKEPWHGRPYSLSLTLPPLSALFFKYERSKPKETTRGGA